MYGHVGAWHEEMKRREKERRREAQACDDFGHELTLIITDPTGCDHRACFYCEYVEEDGQTLA